MRDLSGPIITWVTQAAERGGAGFSVPYRPVLVFPTRYWTRSAEKHG